MATSIEQRIGKFKSDLADNSAQTVLRKHVLFGECYSLEHERYYELKQEIADNFALYPNEIVMVGSGKLGFGITEKPQKPRFREFGDESDYDMAIISASLFDKIWTEVHEFRKTKPIWDTEADFKNYLFNGWIRPDKLPFEFHVRKAWFQFFNGLTKSRKYGGISINAGLYKSWDFLEKYQLKSD